jgi:hypothetical protein
MEARKVTNIYQVFPGATLNRVIILSDNYLLLLPVVSFIVLTHPTKPPAHR